MQLYEKSSIASIILMQSQKNEIQLIYTYCIYVKKNPQKQTGKLKPKGYEFHNFGRRRHRYDHNHAFSFFHLCESKNL